MEEKKEEKYYYAVYLYKNELHLSAPLANETPIEYLFKLLGSKGDRAVMLVFQTEITKEQYERMEKIGKKNDKRVLKELHEEGY